VILLPRSVKVYVATQPVDLRKSFDGLSNAAAARWRTGDPEVDIDGHPRPMIEGTLDVAGADVPVVAPETQAP